MKKSVEYERFMHCLTEMLKKYGGTILKRQRESSEETGAACGDIEIGRLVRIWKLMRIQFASSCWLL